MHRRTLARRKGHRENVHVEVPRIVLSSRLQGPNRFGKPVAVQDRADVPALLHRSNGTPVERLLDQRFGTLQTTGIEMLP